MKTVYCPKYGDSSIYELREMEIPKPKENELLIEVYRAVVSPTDANFRSGSPFISRLFTGLLKPKKAVHGEMFVGVVSGIGSSVLKFKKNDIVYGTNGMNLGAYAEYMIVNTKEAVKKVPSDIDYKDALPLLDGGITALPFLKELAKVKPGDHVLVNGASGAVGSMGVMIAKHLGATVTAVCSTKNIEVVESLKPDIIIDYTKNDFTQRDNTYDVVFDAVGKSSFSAAKDSLTSSGIYVTTMPTPGVMIQALTKKNSPKKRASFMAAGLRKPHIKITDLEYLEELIRNKELTPLHGKEYSMDELGLAQDYVEAGHKVGNVSLVIKN